MAPKTRKTSIHKEIFNYLDFRSFVKDLVAEFKATRKGFTMRSFAKSAGFGSPSYLKMILDGDRSLTMKAMEKFCIALELNGKEKDYFVALAQYNQETEPDTKNELFEKLIKLRPRKALTEIEKSQLKYLTNHHYGCIREMTLLEDFSENSKWIASRCLPRISPNDARDAIEDLINLGFLKRDEKGNLIQANEVVGTQAQTEYAEAYNFHDAALKKARECLSQSKREERYFEALTIPTTKNIRENIIPKITALIEEALEEVNQEGTNTSISYDEVYQLNVQFFPVTTKDHIYKASESEEDSETESPNKNRKTKK